jgi:hypothetical protein
MDKIGLADRVMDAVNNIAAGRIGLATNGEEHAGRVSYELGLSGASRVFDEVHDASDAELLHLAEHTFLQQELHSCDATNPDALASLTLAVDSFDDALRALEVVLNRGAYREAEKPIPETVRTVSVLTLKMLFPKLVLPTKRVFATHCAPPVLTWSSAPYMSSGGKTSGRCGQYIWRCKKPHLVCSVNTRSGLPLGSRSFFSALGMRDN